MAKNQSYNEIDHTKLCHLVYISRASTLFSASDLLTLLKKARARNAQHSITGMLLYKDQSFVQVLEGNANSIEDTFNLICGDDRHSRIRVLIKGPINERDFSDWQMGFQNLDDLDPEEIPGYANFFEDESILADGNGNASRVLTLLRYFRTRS